MLKNTDREKLLGKSEHFTKLFYAFIYTKETSINLLPCKFERSW